MVWVWSGRAVVVDDDGEGGKKLDVGIISYRASKPPTGKDENSEFANRTEGL